MGSEPGFYISTTMSRRVCYRVTQLRRGQENEQNKYAGFSFLIFYSQCGIATFNENVFSGLWLGPYATVLNK